MSLHNGIAVTRSPARAISAGDVRPSTQGAPVLKVRAGEMHAAAQTASTSAHVRPSMTLTSGHGLQEEEAALWSQPSTLGLVGGVSGLQWGTPRNASRQRKLAARGEGRVTVTEKGGDGWRGEGGEEADRG